MTAALKTVIYPVTDLTRAKELFTALLAIEPYMDQPHYVGFSVDGQDIGLDPHGHGKGMSGPVGYWHVEDIEASLKKLLDAGANLERPVSDVGGGKRIATVTDIDGNVIGLLQQP